MELRHSLQACTSPVMVCESDSSTCVDPFAVHFSNETEWALSRFYGRRYSPALGNGCTRPVGADVRRKLTFGGR
jgi:hypothetical protein